MEAKKEGTKEGGRLPGNPNIPAHNLLPGHRRRAHFTSVTPLQLCDPLFVLVKQTSFVTATLGTMEVTAAH